MIIMKLYNFMVSKNMMNMIYQHKKDIKIINLADFLLKIHMIKLL